MKENQKTSKISIIANGDFELDENIKTALVGTDLLICADGGANQAINNGLVPDYVVGDFDSVDKSAFNEIEKVKFVETPEQHNTDLEKTLDFALTFNPVEIVIFGATGKRTDQVLGNISLLVKYSNKTKVKIVDNYCTIYCIRDKIEFSEKVEHSFSIYSYSESCEGVNESGVKYPLVDHNLIKGTLGISNSINSNKAIISLKKGILIVFLNHKS